MKKGIFGFVLGIASLASLHCFGQVERGRASYYADKFKGRHTSSGELYHPDSLTCAHRTHPFGTILLVACPAKGTSVYVRVNDRGPFGKGRVVDLSKAAAQKLDIVLAGVAEVEVQMAAPEPQVPIFPAPIVLETLTIRRTTIPPSHYPPQPPIINPQPPRALPPVTSDRNGTKGRKLKRSKSRV